MPSGVRAADVAVRLRYAGAAPVTAEPRPVPAIQARAVPVRPEPIGRRDGYLHRDARRPSGIARLGGGASRRCDDLSVPDLLLVSLYPDLLRTYGDRGNVLTLRQRAEWRGFDVRVEEVSRGDRLPPGANIVLIGGGTDRVQVLVGRDLRSSATELADAAAAGCVILGICGGYQLLGRNYVATDGASIEGIGLLDVTTTAPASGRIVGRCPRARGALEPDVRALRFREPRWPHASGIGRVTAGHHREGARQQR